jgi:tight adherence protein B
MLLAAIVFVLAWLATMGVVWLLWKAQHSARIERVTRRLTGAGATQDRSPKGPRIINPDTPDRGRLVMQLAARLRLIERLRLLIEQAGLKWDVARTLHGCLALFLAGFSFVWYLTPAFRRFAPLFGVACGMMPIVYILRVRRDRLRKFEEMFPEGLEFLARSMRAGHAFTVSLELIHSEFRDPLASEFRRVFDEQNLGLPLEVAFQKLAERVPLMDVRFFVSAVLLQKRTGGNLAELLDKLAYLIRERFKLRGRIRAISAHGRMTGTVLSLIPVAVGLIMSWINRDLIMFFFTDELGKLMLGAALGLQLLGYLIIRKIVAIEV